MEDKTIKRISRFAIVGVFNTAFDFGILNLLVFVFGLPNVGANIISGTVAASVSFFLNQRFVFKAERQKSGRQFILFITITAFGLYVLQNIVIYTFTHFVTAPASWCYEIINTFNQGLLSKDFVKLNFAKVLATVLSLTWNYYMYGRFVFKNRSEPF